MQIFPRQLNLLPQVLGGLGAVASVGLVGAVWYFGSPSHLQVGYRPQQPVDYSHRLHAGELGMDCRYCHANVERSQEAMIPPTQTCMGCHSVVQADSPLLQTVRDSWESGESIPWVRVHKLPEHAYFDHSVHVAVGVGCVSCHGRVDQMEVVEVEEPISMQWCLDCHRDPVPHLRPPNQVTNMSWEPDATWIARQEQMRAVFESRLNPNARWDDPAFRQARGVSEEVVADMVHPPEYCSGCHR